MYKVTIIDKDSKIVKEYQKDGYYISNAYAFVKVDPIQLPIRKQVKHIFIADIKHLALRFPRYSAFEIRKALPAGRIMDSIRSKSCGSTRQEASILLSMAI